MTRNFEQNLQKYADLSLQVGVNLQPGQRLLIRGSYMYPGVSLHAAPLVRQIAERAYLFGARSVDVIWSDDHILLSRFRHASPDTFTEYPAWLAKGILEYAERGDAMIAILTEDPDLLSGQDPDLVGIFQKTARQNLLPVSEYVARNGLNWLGIGAFHPGWAAKVFPDLPAGEQQSRLWESIFKVCRLDQPDPLSAWQDHLNILAARKDFLNHKQYTALRFTGPGTDLTVGLPQGHIWRGGSITSQAGIVFTPNLPTEEVFTLPHRELTQGVVQATRPLSHGSLIENFSLTFEQGRVVKVSAEKGELILRKLVENDEGAGRLGEVALVPHSSPIAQSGLLFYNTLYDENAASHVALGRAYKFNLQGGESMPDEEFVRAGGNNSLVHVDFMIGSGEMDVDGMNAQGYSEPVMRHGEWAFDLA